jgi:WD40 repeat protein
MNPPRRLRTLFSVCLIIMAVLFSKHSTAASVSGDTRPEVFVQLGHSDNVYSLSYSLDGKRLVSTGRDKAVKVWDVDSGREIVSFTPGGNLITAFYSNDGEHVWTVQETSGPMLWDIASGKSIARLDYRSSIRSAACSPDRKCVMVAENGRLVYWNLVTRRQIFTLKTKTGAAMALSISNNGKYCALAHYSDDYPNPQNTVQVYRITDRRLVGLIKGDAHTYTAVALSPDGRTLITGVGNGEKESRALVYDVASGKMIASFSLKLTVFNMAFSPDGKTAAAGTYGEVALFDTATWKIKRLQNGEYPVAFSPDSRGLAYTSNYEYIHGISTFSVGIMMLDLETGKTVRRFSRNSEWNTFASFGPTGDTVIVSGIRRSVWDLKTGSRTRSVFLSNQVGKAEWVNAVSPDESQGMENTEKDLRKWDMESGRLITSFPRDWTSSARRMRYSPSGKRLVTGMWDGTLSLWDTVNLKRIRIFNGKQKGSISAIAFTPDERYVFTAGDSDEKVLYKWDMETGSLSGSFSTDHSVTDLDVSPNGLYLISAGFTGSSNDLELWNARSGMKLKTFRGHRDIVHTVRFSRDSRYAASGSSDGVVKLWDVKTGQAIRTFKGHSGLVDCVGFSPDGNRLVTTSRDGTVRLWDTQTGKEIVRFVSFTDDGWIAFTPEGYYNASPGADAHVNVHMGHSVYGIDNFREAFFRPDLVKVAVSGGALGSFMALSDVKQPPTVVFTGTPPATSQDRVTVRLGITDNGGGIGEIRLYLNGTAVSTDSRAVILKNLVNRTLVREYTVPLLPGKNALKAVAFNGTNTAQSSEAAWTVTSSFVEETRPSLHALVIGIKDFANPRLTLTYTTADAALFSDTLNTAAAGLFDTVDIRTRTSPETTTKDAIVKDLATFKTLRPNDVFVFYIASHGTVDDGSYYLITSNVGSLRTEKLKTDAMSQNTLKEAIANIPATKKVIIIDTCNAGALGDAIQSAMLTRGLSEDTALKILSRSVGCTILSASTSVQEAIEGYNGHGLFTYVLTEGLKGKADKGNTGFINTTGLADYVDGEVPSLAEKIFKRAQYPTISISGQAFPIGKSR